MKPLTFFLLVNLALLFLGYAILIYTPFFKSLPLAFGLVWGLFSSRLAKDLLIRIYGKKK